MAELWAQSGVINCAVSSWRPVTRVRNSYQYWVQSPSTFSFIVWMVGQSAPSTHLLMTPNWLIGLRIMITSRGTFNRLEKWANRSIVKFNK